jgi:hypothetical protein
VRRLRDAARCAVTTEASRHRSLPDLWLHAMVAPGHERCRPIQDKQGVTMNQTQAWILIVEVGVLALAALRGLI